MSSYVLLRSEYLRQPLSGSHGACGCEGIRFGHMEAAHESILEPGRRLGQLQQVAHMPQHVGEPGADFRLHAVQHAGFYFLLVQRWRALMQRLLNNQRLPCLP